MRHFGLRDVGAAIAYVEQENCCFTLLTLSGTRGVCVAVIVEYNCLCEAADREIMGAYTRVHDVCRAIFRKSILWAAKAIAF